VVVTGLFSANGYAGSVLCVLQCHPGKKRALDTRGILRDPGERHRIAKHLIVWFAFALTSHELQKSLPNTISVFRIPAHN